MRHRATPPAPITHAAQAPRAAQAPQAPHGARCAADTTTAAADVAIGLARRGDIRDWQPAWERRLSATDTPCPTHTPAWALACWAAHAPERSFRTLVSASAGEPVLIVPYRVEPAPCGAGSAIEVMTELSPFWTAEPAAAALERMRAHLDAEVPDWAVIRFSMQSGEDPLVRDLPAAAAALGLGFDAVQTHDSPRLDLTGGHADYLRARGRKLKQALRRKESRLAALGRLRITRARRPEDIAAAVARMLEIEQESWKYDRASDMTSRGQQHVFYSALAGELAAAGRISLNTLEVGDEPIAYELDIWMGDVVYLIKHSYKRRLQAFSPGVILRAHTVEEYFQREVKTADFWGAADPFKLLWTDRTVPHHALSLFRRSWRGDLVRARQLAGRRLSASPLWHRLNEWTVGPVNRHKLKDPPPPHIHRVLAPLRGRIPRRVASLYPHPPAPVPPPPGLLITDGPGDDAAIDRLVLALGSSALSLRHQPDCRRESRAAWHDQTPVAALLAVADGPRVRVIDAYRRDPTVAPEVLRALVAAFARGLAGRGVVLDLASSERTELTRFDPAPLLRAL